MKRFLSARRMTAAVVLTAALMLGACASTGPTAAAPGVGESTAATSSGPWTFTDDAGKTVTLDSAPTRIAAYADYAAGLNSYGVSPVAIWGRMDVAKDARFASTDLSKTAIVGNSYGEIDLEALAAAEPQIIVAGIYPTDRKGTLDLKGPLYSFADREQQDQIEKIAPVIALKVGGNGADVVDNFNRMATALGAQQSAVDEAKAGFETAKADLTAATKESGIEVTQMYADADGIYVVKPSDEPETALYSSLGVNYTNLRPDGYYYWDIYTWENAAKMMTGDVLLVNEEGFQKDALADQATFADHPALKAGQVHTWQVSAFDYGSQTEQMKKLTDIIKQSKKV